jgi:hypothetical protein
MKNCRVRLLFLFWSLTAIQVSFANSDSLRIGAVRVSGYADLYYGYDFNKPENGNHPYAVSSARHAKPAINLAYLSFVYESTSWRIRLAPAAGSYMVMNYAAEPRLAKYIFEANTGFRLSAKKNIWVDAGIFGSPFTNESPVSRDQLTYTRSLSAEFVPYYLSGARISWPVNQKWQFNFYAITGWQQIKDQNKTKALATQLIFKPKAEILVNWNTFLGNESSAGDTYDGFRFFNDFYFIKKSGRWTVSSCVYLGVQEQSGNKLATWWQGNLIAKFSLTDKLSISGRMEYFKDKSAVQIKSITGNQGFVSFSSSAGLNFQLMPNLLYRIECRLFDSPSKGFIRSAVPAREDTWLTTGLTWWF